MVKNLSLKAVLAVFVIGMFVLSAGPAVAINVKVTVSTTTAGEGSVTVEDTTIVVGETPVDFTKEVDEVMEFTLTPSSGHRVKRIKVDGDDVQGGTSKDIAAETPVTNPFVWTVAGNFFGVQVEIVLEPGEVYEIEATAGEGGTIDPAGDVWLKADEAQEPYDVTFAITPDTDNYSVADVLVGTPGTSQGAVDTLTVSTGDLSVDSVYKIEAQFTQGEMHNITTSVSGSGAIDPPDSPVKVGEEQNKEFTLTPEDGNWIKDVTLDGTSVMDAVTIDEAGVGTYTLANVLADQTLAVEFAVKHTVTLTVGDNGAVDPPAGDVAVAEGNTQVFTITPAANYGVDTLMLDDTSVKDSLAAGSAEGTYTYTFTPDPADDDKAYALDVTFAEQVDVTITITVDGNGTVDPPGPLTVEQGASQTLDITPDADYIVADVTKNGTSVMGELTFDEQGATTYTFNADQAYTIAVTFRHNLDVNADGVLCTKDVVGMLQSISKGEDTYTLANVVTVLKILIGITGS